MKAHFIFYVRDQGASALFYRRELPDPTGGGRPPRAELYLLVDDPAAFHERALAGGARELSPLLERDWGDRAAYSLDPDGHVLAFAARATT